MEQALARKGDRFPTAAIGLSIGLHLCVFGALAAAAMSRPGTSAVVPAKGSTIAIALIPVDGTALPHMLPVVNKAPVPELSPLPTETAATSGARPSTDSKLPARANASNDGGTMRSDAMNISVSNGATLSNYQDLLLAYVERFRAYPIDARRRGVQGVTTVHFEMNRTGKVLTVWVEGSSGSAVLDEAALDTIQRAQPLPVIPPDLPDDMDILMPIAFSLPKTATLAAAAPSRQQ